VAAESSGTRLGDRPLQDLLRARQPQLDLPAGVCLLEDLDDRHRVLEVQGSVDDDLALFFRPFEDALFAIGALVQVDLPVLSGIPLPLGENEPRNKRRSQRARKEPPAAGINSTAHVSSLLRRKACSGPSHEKFGRTLARPPVCTACSRLPSAVLLKASEGAREPEGDLRDVLARCRGSVRYVVVASGCSVVYLAADQEHIHARIEIVRAPERKLLAFHPRGVTGRIEQGAAAGRCTHVGYGGAPLAAPARFPGHHPRVVLVGFETSVGGGAVA